jgi:anaerobic ribonucleoside-triphosphate reductase
MNMKLTEVSICLDCNGHVVERTPQGLCARCGSSGVDWVARVSRETGTIYFETPVAAATLAEQELERLYTL